MKIPGKDIRDSRAFKEGFQREISKNTPAAKRLPPDFALAHFAIGGLCHCGSRSGSKGLRRKAGTQVTQGSLESCPGLSMAPFETMGDPWNSESFHNIYLLSSFILLYTCYNQKSTMGRYSQPSSPSPSFTPSPPSHSPPPPPTPEE